VSDFFNDRKLFQITPWDIEQFKKQRKETPVRGGKIRSDPCGENGKKLVRNEDLVRNETEGTINATA